MKTLSKVAGSILICLILLLLTLRVVGFEPRDRRPGLWLKGELVTTPVTDWSFTDKYANILVETRSWYGLPHSVTTNCISHNGQLYLTSTYSPGMQFPRDRAWNRYVMRDPHVRLKIGGQLYDRTLSFVTDPAEKDAVLQSKAKKYPDLKPAKKENVYVFHVLPG